MSFLAPIGIKILVGLAITGAVIGIFLGIRNGGKIAEKAEQIERNFKVRRAQDAIAVGDPDDIDRLFDGM